MSGATSAAPLLFQINMIGPTDAEHTSVDGLRDQKIYQWTDSGFAVGFAGREGQMGWGSSVMVFDGTITRLVGLRGDGYFEDPDNHSIFPSGVVVGSGGHVIGNQLDNFTVGRLSWVDDGVQSRRIGLKTPVHTRYSDGTQYSSAKQVNSSGQVIGTSYRYDTKNTDDTGAASHGRTGFSAWFYDGATTQEIGLRDARHSLYLSWNNYHRESGVVRLSDSGKVIGYSESYWERNGYDTPETARSFWAWQNGVTTRIGLFDAEHSAHVNGKQHSAFAYTNSAAQAAGVQTRYGLNELGQSAWLYDGTTTTKIGLLNSAHLRASDGYRYNAVRGMNEAGQVIGDAERFGAASESLGRQAWIYDGATTRAIGLKGAEVTDATTGYRYSYATKLNNAGQVAGYSKRYDAAGDDLGRAAWFYDGNATARVGLYDAGHTRSVDGYRYSDVQQLAESGQVAGTSRRFAADGGYGGGSAWLFNGTTTIQIGLDETDFVDIQGANVIKNRVTMLNDTGLAAGYTSQLVKIDQPTVDQTEDCYYNGFYDPKTNECYKPVHSGAGYPSQTAWVYDGTDTIGLGALSSRSDGYSYSEVTYLGDDGLVIGSYRAFDELDNFLGDYAFAYNAEMGLIDFDTLIDESFVNQNWDSINEIFINDAGAIVGNGTLADGSTMAFQLTGVPVPPAIWLFASALTGLGWFRRRRAA